MAIFDRLEHFMQTWRHTTVSLNPPASAAQIEAAEKAMHVRLPDEVRAAYRRFNGVTREAFSPAYPARHPGPALFVNMYDWVDLERMVSLWRMMKSIEAQFMASGVWQRVRASDIQPHLKARPVDWCRKWVPIGDSGHFDKVYVDVAPIKAGVRGQIVYAGRGFGPEVSAVGFNSYLERLLTAYDSGKLILDKGYFWKTRSGAIVTDLASAGV